MPVDAGLPTLGLSLGLSSSADSGDDIVTPSFNVDFGDKLSAGAGGGATPISGLVRDFATALAVAVAAKWIWSKVK